ncbi:MAG: hypothetical protein ACK5JD_06305 [Mangrovibacterium sp.]
MGKFFDIGEMMSKSDMKGEESGLKAKDSNSKALRVRFDAMHEQKISTLKMLCGRLPEENEVFFLETTNSFNAFTFIVYLLKHAGRIDELLIKTYSINIRILDSLSARIRKNEIGDISLYIAESIRYRMPKVKDQLETMTREMNNFQVEYSWTHQKVITARIGEAFYVVEGSGNFSENSAEEQYIFMRSKRIYEFRTGNTN